MENKLKELVDKLLEYRDALSEISMAQTAEGVEAEYWLQKFDRMFSEIFSEILSEYGKGYGK